MYVCMCNINNYSINCIGQAMIYQNIVESEENLKCVFSGSGAGSFGNFDANSKSLLLALLTNSPLMRLGMLRNGIDEIWAQPMLKSKIVL